MYHNKTPIEVSAGYFATTEKIDNENFIQKSIKGNHLAILPVGLKGRSEKPILKLLTEKMFSFPIPLFLKIHLKISRTINF
jgi:hypothetical protein